MTARERMTWVYDRTMIGRNQKEYYGDSGFYNFGYWEGTTASQREASEALVDQLVNRIPQKTGRILDVACGVGGSTRHLQKYYPSDMITAINISERQLAEARKRAPDCHFHCMDATRLDFPDAHFDAVICVEAAFHFETRDAFLREAFRVLKPGGSLVLSDMIFRRFIEPIGPPLQVPRENLVRDIDTYRKRLGAAGFEKIDLQDVTPAVMGGFCRHLAHWPDTVYPPRQGECSTWRERRNGRMKLLESLITSLVCQLVASSFGAAIKFYLLVSAQKPAGHD